ncbi:MAG: GspE/PulE family protein [Pseudomonadota bacterium]
MEGAKSHMEACIGALIGAGAISQPDLDRARATSRKGESPMAAATRMGLLSADSYADTAARTLGFRRMAVAEVAALPGPPATGAPQRSFIAGHQVALAEDTDGALMAALADPFDQALISALRMGTDRPITLAVTTEAAIAAWRRQHLAADGPSPRQRPAEPTASGEAVEAMEALLEKAARTGASDLHLEPTAEGGIARARIDGVMRRVGSLDRATYPAAIARAKVLARLDVAERRLPQDGRARMALAGRQIDLRLSTAPAMEGETLAIRLLDPAAAPGRLDALGFPDEYAGIVAAASRAPHGLFLLTGPTGAGKTTTLHAALSMLSDEARKIMTVEDPVEYALPGAVQMQVKSEIGFDFARAQRTMLRHNPDVMMVGEIRDGESASIAIQAALTGHLVLSTVHANSAAGAAIRLLDLGVEPFLISAALIGAGAQRLARRLCPDCAEPDHPDREALHRIGAPRDGTWRRAPTGPNGCATCGGTGIKGRAPVAEAFLANREFSDAVRGAAPSEAALAALTDATPLHQAALALAAAGTIALDEALRVAPISHAAP